MTGSDVSVDTRAPTDGLKEYPGRSPSGRCDVLFPW